MLLEIFECILMGIGVGLQAIGSAIYTFFKINSIKTEIICVGLGIGVSTYMLIKFLIFLFKKFKQA